jgi:hypothetical protein
LRWNAAPRSDTVNKTLRHHRRAHGDDQASGDKEVFAGISVWNGIAGGAAAAAIGINLNFDVRGTGAALLLRNFIELCLGACNGTFWYLGISLQTFIYRCLMARVPTLTFNLKRDGRAVSPTAVLCTKRFRLPGRGRTLELRDGAPTAGDFGAWARAGRNWLSPNANGVGWLNVATVLRKN